VRARRQHAIPEAQLDALLAKADRIEDPFERSFFVKPRRFSARTS
jgi:hypothetical protein